jgi:hypothetical protein
VYRRGLAHSALGDKTGHGDGKGCWESRMEVFFATRCVLFEPEKKAFSLEPLQDSTRLGRSILRPRSSMAAPGQSTLLAGWPAVHIRCSHGNGVTCQVSSDGAFEPRGLGGPGIADRADNGLSCQPPCQVPIFDSSTRTLLSASKKGMPRPLHGNRNGVLVSA